MFLETNFKLVYKRDNKFKGSHFRYALEKLSMFVVLLGLRHNTILQLYWKFIQIH